MRNYLTNIFLNAPPQSASTFLYESLTNGLSYKNLSQPTLYGGIFPYKNIVTWSAEKTLAGGFVWQDNVEANEVNLLIMEQFFPKVILHFRDPRQCIYSWLQHFPNVMHEERARTLKKLIKLRDNFFDLPIEHQIDHLIQTRLIHYVEYYKKWLEIIDHSKYKVSFLITTYEELTKNQNQVLKKVLEFYELKQELFNFPSQCPEVGKQNYRGNSLTGWEHTFSIQQRKKAGELIPSFMKKKFNWIEY